MQLLWHRRDLRLPDNTALSRAGAAEGGPVVPVFVFDAAVIEHASPLRMAFLVRALEDLQGQYREAGSDLVVRTGAPAEVLPSVAADFGAECIRYNTAYTGLARRREEAVRSALEDAGLAWTTDHDLYLHEPGAITTNAGTPYQRFQYFGQKWQERPKDPPRSVPAPSTLAEITHDRVPNLEALDVDLPTIPVPAAGTAAARERLRAFCDGPIYRYDDGRDIPATDGTSRLSTQLAFGTLGIREVYAATERAMESAKTAPDRDGVEEYRRQLAWREFYGQVLADRSDTVRQPHRDLEKPIDWREDPAGLAAWQSGETGYPLVDAGMRELRDTGYMHNRLRMVVASFLTKHLLIDWRRGYEWFRRQLFDHDTANDVGGWQWAASTGADAQPYYRVFNPMTQAERFDPDAEYIREHINELSQVPPEVIHEWPALESARRQAMAPDYPGPIVDHETARDRALSTFERAVTGED